MFSGIVVREVHVKQQFHVVKVFCETEIALEVEFHAIV